MSTQPVDAEDEILNHFSEWEKRRYVPGPGEPALPPQLTDFASKTADDVMKEINRLPFFMTELDETDGEGGENMGVEALKSLVYEGEPIDVATNFKNQGNESFKGKQYKTAINYYSQGLEVERGEEGAKDALTVSLYINRAACELELKNYRSCINDCKAALSIDPKNVKACYRSGRAFFAVSRFDEAKEILRYGLALDPENASIAATLKQIEKRETTIREAKLKKEKEVKEMELKKSILANAIQLRHIRIIKSSRPTELLEDAKIRLEDELDHESQLIFPAMLVYPTLDEFDYVAKISELTSPLELLETVLNRPKEWFEDPKHKDFLPKKLECYMETESGGLIKLGKKVALNEALMADQPSVPLFDNSLRMYVLPKSESPAWISNWSKEAALAKRIV
ncbi:hsp70/Hsp90 co-chaperone Cns1p [[Candida] railenensis]|uniref:Hsp70/Hsp90 co-chaperone Cns1p n=1 Tax=[Candida] railenensis TaxID=45579 RepID=A0A9P0QMG5_9ASCO|nr:hsp70/Hsp90 co-chaperone Cns1p [[Candida] railenensis]